MTARPPPANLLIQVERARAELAQLEAARKAAWSTEGHDLPTHLLVAQGYHARFHQWLAAKERLKVLERQLEAS